MFNSVILIIQSINLAQLSESMLNHKMIEIVKYIELKKITSVRCGLLLV